MFERFSSFWFNILCGVLHGAFGALLLVESIVELNVGGYSTKLNIHFIELDGTNWPNSVYSVKEFGSLNLVAFLAAFELITSFTHFLYAIYMKAYQTDISLGFNYRYFEYAITAPLMIVVISALFGLREIYSLISMFSLTHITMLFGVLQSWWGAQGSVAAHFFGWIPFLVSWAILLSYFGIVTSNNSVPNFVWAVVFIQFAIFGSFGFVQFYWSVWPHLFKGRGGYNTLENEDYVNSKKAEDGMNNVLSLTSKLLLAGILYGNFYGLENMPSN
jgi:hypothetical protein